MAIQLGRTRGNVNIEQLPLAVSALAVADVSGLVGLVWVRQQSLNTLEASCSSTG